MPEAVFHHQAVTAASVPDVWQSLQDPVTWATVAGVDATSDHTRNDSDLTGFRFTASIAGVTYRGTARVSESRTGERMSLSIRSNELTGSIDVGLAAGELGTALDVTLTMRPAGLLGPILFPVISIAIENGFADSVDRLATSLG